MPTSGALELMHAENYYAVGERAAEPGPVLRTVADSGPAMLCVQICLGEGTRDYTSIDKIMKVRTA